VNQLATKLKAFLNGWESFTVHQRPKTFFKYLTYYPINWSVLFGFSFFIWMMIRSAGKYEAPIFYFMAFIPFSVMVYHFIDEYYAFQWYTTGSRKVSAQKLINILWVVVLTNLATIITLMFV
jgi:hypothetical protein